MFMVCRLYVSLCANAAVTVAVWGVTRPTSGRSVLGTLPLWPRSHGRVHPGQTQFDTLR